MHKEVATIVLRDADFRNDYDSVNPTFTLVKIVDGVRIYAKIHTRDVHGNHYRDVHNYTVSLYENIKPDDTNISKAYFSTRDGIDLSNLLNTYNPPFVDLWTYICLYGWPEQGQLIRYMVHEDSTKGYKDIYWKKPSTVGADWLDIMEKQHNLERHISFHKYQVQPRGDEQPTTNSIPERKFTKQEVEALLRKQAASSSKDIIDF